MIYERIQNTRPAWWEGEEGQLRMFQRKARRFMYGDSLEIPELLGGGTVTRLSAHVYEIDQPYRKRKLTIKKNCTICEWLSENPAEQSIEVLPLWQSQQSRTTTDANSQAKPSQLSA